jgi:hypothetical protein
MAQTDLAAERRAAEKRADIDVAARAVFEVTKDAIEELEQTTWGTLPDVDSPTPSPRCKAHYRDEVSTAVEALWHAGRLTVSAAPPVRGDKWERMVGAGVKAGMTREASEAHADVWAVRVASKLSTDEAADEYASALAKELGIDHSSLPLDRETV